MNNTAIHALLDIAVNTPRETADVFFTISPHCRNISVAIHVGGWTKGVDPQHQEYVDYNDEGAVNCALGRVESFIANINPAERKRKAAHDRLEKARLEMHAATEAAREFEAICRHCGEKESEHASGAQICIGGGGSQFSPVWTPESGEPCPMEELHKFSVTEEQIEAHEAMEDFNRPDLRWRDSQEAEDHNDRSKPL